MELNRRNFLKFLGSVAIAAAIPPLAGCKKNEEIEHVDYTIDAPSPHRYDSIPFVSVNRSRCQGCDTCNEQCPTGAIDGPVPGGKHSIPHHDLCMNCGQCLVHCPYGAVQENVSFISKIRRALNDPDVKVVAMPAPAVRYALGDPFGLRPGEYAGGKMFTALRRLGFDYVWDNEFAADLTILEEGSELVGRITRRIDKPLPQFTSCCPGWIKYAETFYPDLIPNLSTCKSPIGMMGALAKTYGAQKTGTNPAKMFTVSIMPCIAKKFEGLRPEMRASGYRDIDATINTRELAHMIRQAGINFAGLGDEGADPLLGVSTGAATIFGASGGVMEAALRYAYETVSGRPLGNLDFTALRGLSGVREASVAIPGGPTLRVCVVSGLRNVKPIADQVRAGRSPYHFIEVMTCPGGCINGGGQPLSADMTGTSWHRNTLSSLTRALRKNEIS